MFKSDQALMEKWGPVLDHESAPAIADSHKRAVTARLLENTEEALRQEAAQSSYSINEALEGTSTASVANPDPVLISLVRRAMPNLIAYDVASVQPMSGPTGLIFAMKSRYDDQSGGVTTADTEALFDEADTDFSGDGAHKAGQSSTTAVNLSTVALGDICQVTVATGTTGAQWTTAGATTDDAVATVGTVFKVTGAVAGTGKVVVLGSTGTGKATAAGEDGAPNKMGFTVEKVTVEAKTRVLQAEYTMELAQDLKAVHGLDAEAELANILSAEILGEINREVIRNINETAKVGTTGTSTGYLDLSITSGSAGADGGAGRWQAEVFQGLAYRLEQEANIIAKETRRGKGNYIICSSSVAAALSAAGSMAYGTGQDSASLAVDNAGNTFAGTLKNGMKVYVDPYAVHDYATVGYKGTNTYDAGIFYCPYVPLTMLKAVNAEDFQPKVGFKTRYGLQQNPFAGTATGIGSYGSNPYFRRNLIIGV
jgi:hypothetical protein